MKRREYRHNCARYSRICKSRGDGNQ